MGVVGGMKRREESEEGGWLRQAALSIIWASQKRKLYGPVKYYERAFIWASQNYMGHLNITSERLFIWASQTFY